MNGKQVQHVSRPKGRWSDAEMVIMAAANLHSDWTLTHAVEWAARQLPGRSRSAIMSKLLKLRRSKGRDETS